jgi:hypothetical protein
MECKVMEMQKSMKSVTANPVWLTELTDAEMEATTGGLNNRDLDGLLTVARAYANRPLSAADTRLIRRWFQNLPRRDKALLRSLSILNDQ